MAFECTQTGWEAAQIVSNHNLQALGDAIRRARESRNLTVEQAERETRIRAKFLVAIEKGDLSEMPSRVQARGFMYNYAQYLGLNPNDIIAQFDTIHGGTTQPSPVQGRSAPPQQGYPAGQPPVQPPPPYHPPPQPNANPQYPPQQPPPAQTQRQGPIPRLTTPPTPIPTPLPGVPSPENGAPPPPDTLVGRLLASDVFVISMMMLVAVVVLGIGGRALGNLSTGSSSGAQPTLSGRATGSVTPTFAPTSTPTPTTPPLASDRVRISFEVTQRNWLRVDVDGENVFEGLAEPGTILQYEGLQEVRVMTGNGAALDVTYNGVDIGPLGERGDVVEQIYTVGGLETLTPTPSPTVTNTPIPTATGEGASSPDGEVESEDADGT